ncbi:protein translocase subunit SecA2, chloroplastic isoform X1 [Tanacetum coccineum]
MKSNYRCDITYTNNSVELGLDYLRDNLAGSSGQLVMRWLLSLVLSVGSVNNVVVFMVCQSLMGRSEAVANGLLITMHDAVLLRDPVDDDEEGTRVQTDALIKDLEHRSSHRD